MQKWYVLERGVKRPDSALQQIQDSGLVLALAVHCNHSHNFRRWIDSYRTVNESDEIDWGRIVPFIALHLIACLGPLFVGVSDSGRWEKFNILLRLNDGVL